MLGIAVVGAGLSAFAGLACNAIVGVTDVKYKSQASAQEGGTSGDDDDDDTIPDPVKPTTDSGSGTTDSRGASR